MVKIEVNNNKSIYGIGKTEISNKLMLRWRSTGLSNFLVISSLSEEDVTITEDNKALYMQIIERKQNELIREKIARLENNLMCFLVSLDELRRDGGLQIKNMPTCFAVYGIDIEQDDFVIYYENKSYANNIYSMTIDVFIRDEAYYLERHGLFKKGEEYSGYHRVTMSTPYPALVGGVLKYNIDGVQYSFPDEVVKNGGSFYVCADNNMNLHFESSNQGIIIK